ncbi:hypothetical protein PHLCEN_2v4476 [Hermanssonia centrifuga]|uniref:ATP-dependent rRNA helicase SPB4-like C-terminal extension domain-containing protein n=1 Tax=Hermanssonia centrifuga TaxID=98765 RepID=A0A2R6PN73_9APHY|nr:hypothetical protein PHLCEN_2v4476 [Hermanssonia centrifuga]
MSHYTSIPGILTSIPVYKDFMAVRKIPLKERRRFDLDGSLTDNSDGQPEDPEVQIALEAIRKTVLTDRTLYDKAVKAFVSFVRAYSKHEASYIFRIKDLDLIGVAKSFGLLRLPRMPELKDAPKDGWQDADMNWSAYSYIDKVKEAKRLAEAEKKPVSMVDIESTKRQRAEQKKVNAAWSNNSSRREEREKRKEKKDRKRKWEKTQLNSATENGTKDDKELDSGEDEEDWEELAREERMAKKVKRGEVSQGEFDKEFADL